jgi:hypothetical protein
MPSQEFTQRDLYTKMIDLLKGDEFRPTDDELVTWYGEVGERHVDLLKTHKSYKDVFNVYASQEMLEKETKFTLGMLSTQKDSAIKGGLKFCYHLAAMLPTAIMQRNREKTLTNIVFGPEPK